MKNERVKNICSFISLPLLTLPFITYSANAEENQPPVAVATVSPLVTQIGQTIRLDGSGSYDDTTPTENLRYHWALIHPTDGGVFLGSEMVTAFIADVPGDYYVTLGVWDQHGEPSVEAANVIVVVRDGEYPSPIPVITADPMLAYPGQTVYLDGSGSFDNITPTENLIYHWSVLSPPGPYSLHPSGMSALFIPRSTGEYQVELVVFDEDGFYSPPAQIFIAVDTIAPPVADAGPDQIVALGSTVYLDGTGSYDPNGFALNYSWYIRTRPIDQLVRFTGYDTATPSFAVGEEGVEGEYLIELIVSNQYDHALWASDEVSVMVVSNDQYAETLVTEVSGTVTNLPETSVTTTGNQTALGQFFIQAMQATQEGDSALALKKLQMALERTDGCALRGTPDAPGLKGEKQDYINNCTDQSQVYPVILNAINAINNGL